jgi:hypothetical protein
MGNKKVKLCPCLEDPDPIGLGFKRIKKSELNKKSSYKPLEAHDFVPAAFFVFIDDKIVTYSWAFKIRKGRLCHVTLRSYMGKSIINLVVDDEEILTVPEFETSSV